MEKPDYYTDQRKIHYTLSYLSGTAKEWFEPDILDPDSFNPPAWSISFPALVKELQENFRLYDAQGEAESCLGNIQMHTNEQVRKYNIRFNTLAALTNWNESALKWAYKNGLVDHIKDELARIPEPATWQNFDKRFSASMTDTGNGSLRSGERRENLVIVVIRIKGIRVRKVNLRNPTPVNRR